MEKIIENRIIENGIIKPITLEFNDEQKSIRVTDDYIDISYGTSATPARVLSNLYPYKFDYFDNPVCSMEAAIQSLKYENIDIRKACYKYAGIDAWHLRGMAPYAWQKDGILYTPVKKINRFSEEYQDFLDKLYFMIYQNPLFRNNLKHSGVKKLDHTIGEDDYDQTTLTRTEYISRLYALRYCLHNQLLESDEVVKVLKMVRTQLKGGD